MNALSRLPVTLGAFMRGLHDLIHDQKRRRRLTALYPGVHFEWPVHFLVDDFGALSLAAGVCIGPFSEIVVLRSAPQSPVPGGLAIGTGVRLGMGANLRAAGGGIRIGAGTQIGQHVSIIASNHLFDHPQGRAHADRWDAAKTGVTIGEGCWIGAGVVLLPGVTLGDGAVIGAGSIVTRSVGAGQTWHGNPARPAGNPAP